MLKLFKSGGFWLAVKKNCPQSNTNYFVIVITIAVDFPIPIKRLLKHDSYYYTYCLLIQSATKKKLVPDWETLALFFFLKKPLGILLSNWTTLFLKTF